jgi:hypothetical protein
MDHTVYRMTFRNFNSLVSKMTTIETGCKTGTF